MFFFKIFLFYCLLHTSYTYYYCQFFSPKCKQTHIHFLAYTCNCNSCISLLSHQHIKQIRDTLYPMFTDLSQLTHFHPHTFINRLSTKVTRSSQTNISIPVLTCVAARWGCCVILTLPLVQSRGLSRHDIRMLCMIWKTAEPQTTNKNKAINAGPTGDFSSVFFKVLGIFPLAVMFLLCLSLAILIRCLFAMVFGLISAARPVLKLRLVHT